MKNVLSLDETPSALDRSFKAAARRKRELQTDTETESIPLGELSSFVQAQKCTLPWSRCSALRMCVVQVYQ